MAHEKQIEAQRRFLEAKRMNVIFDPNRPRVTANQKCPACDGTGNREMERTLTAQLMGSALPMTAVQCFVCHGRGYIVTATYTRGVSLTPLIGGKPRHEDL